MNIQEELKELKERIAELEGQAKRGQEFLQSGERYWCISGGGGISSFFWKSEQFDLDRYRVDNIFKTQEQAEFAVEKLKVEAELRKYGKHFEDDISDWYMFYDTESQRIYIDSIRYCQTQGAIYFESENKAQQAINTVGKERIKKYIFGVED